MPPRDYDDRRVEVYFGPSPKADVTKEELAEFIIDRMGLKRSDGGPKWTDGVTELVKIGMETWDRQRINRRSIQNQVDRLDNRIDKYNSELEKLTQKIDERQSTEDMIDTARRVHRTEAQILEVLSRGENMGVKSPNYVDFTSLANQTSLHRYTVVYYAQSLSTPVLDSFVEIDRYSNGAKLSSSDSFKKYCKHRRIDQDEIHRLNEVSEEHN